MRKSIVILIVFIMGILLVSTGKIYAEKENVKMQTLKIKWQRLVYGGGKTCERCGETGQEVRNAVEKLTASLRPLEIKVVLEEKALSVDACTKDILESNRIWIAEKPLEEWLSAKEGKSPCSTCCEGIGENVECRTVEMNGKMYEAIPADLIVQAGLLAAAEIVKGQPTGLDCCAPEVKKKVKEKSCCP